MTRELGDLGEELEALYGEGLRDLTFYGYTRASQQLRNDDPAMARRVDRRLDPFLRTKVFPRRRREWQETSEGTRARLALLAENPHLERDVRDVRSVLGVPDSQVRVLEGDDLWNQAAEVVRPECVRQEVERQLVGGWHLIHLQAALGRELDEDIAWTGRISRSHRSPKLGCASPNSASSVATASLSRADSLRADRESTMAHWVGSARCECSFRRASVR